MRGLISAAQSAVLAGLVIACGLLFQKNKELEGRLDTVYIKMESSIYNDEVFMDVTVQTWNRLQSHIEEGCVTDEIEDLMMKQVDLMMNVSRRGGWWLWKDEQVVAAHIALKGEGFCK